MTANAEQRPHNRPRGRINTGKPRRTRTPEDMGDERFRLVVGRMRNGNSRGTTLLNHSPKETVSKTPRTLFNVAVVPRSLNGNISAFDNEFQAKVSSQFSDKLCVAFGFLTTKTVIEVNHRERNPNVVANAVEQPQKRDRV